MTRLRLLALLLLLLLPDLSASAAPAPVFSLQEDSVKTAARAYAAEVCKTAETSCGEAKSLLDGYLNALLAATACDAGKCSLDEIGARAESVAELDRRDGALPPPGKGRTDRPFLALSAVATARLTAAASRLGKPYAAVIYGPDARTEALRTLETFCIDVPAHCRDMRALLAAADTLSARVAACGTSKCALDQVDPIIEDAKRVVGLYFDLRGLSKMPTTDVYGILSETHNAGIALYTPLADLAVADLEKGAEGLAAGLDRVEKDAAAPIAPVEASGRDLFERQRSAARATDRLAYHLGYDPKVGAGARRDKVNAVEIKLAGLRSRALALRLARGLTDDKGGAGAVSGGPGGAASLKPGVVLSEPVKTIIDRRLVPNLSPISGNAPPIAPGSPSGFQLARNLLSEDSTIKADALRRLGRTQTVGDPGRYVAAAFTQKDDASCAVSAQAQILHAHGLLPPGQTGATQEQSLLGEARNRGYMIEGTPPAYGGSLLVDRGMLVVKRRDAATFENALKRGSLMQVGVNANVLWKRRTTGLAAHSVIITGAEISKSDGSILGVYINDSGTNPPGAGKFVPWSLMQKAWRGYYAEIQ